MATLQYSTNGSAYTNMPSSMLGGTFAGRFELSYPEPTTFTLSGIPAGAFGLPSVILRSALMSASGMQNWINVFAGDTDLYATIYIDAWNPYSNAVTRVSGTILRPKWDRVQLSRGGDVANYENVEIDIINCTGI